MLRLTIYVLIAIFGSFCDKQMFRNPSVIIGPSSSLHFYQNGVGGGHGTGWRQVRQEVIYTLSSETYMGLNLVHFIQMHVKRGS